MSEEIIVTYQSNVADETVREHERKICWEFWVPGTDVLRRVARDARGMYQEVETFENGEVFKVPKKADQQTIVSFHGVRLRFPASKLDKAPLFLARLYAEQPTPHGDFKVWRNLATVAPHKWGSYPVVARTDEKDVKPRPTIHGTMSVSTSRKTDVATAERYVARLFERYVLPDIEWTLDPNRVVVEKLKKTNLDQPPAFVVNGMPVPDEIEGGKYSCYAGLPASSYWKPRKQDSATVQYYVAALHDVLNLVHMSLETWRRLVDATMREGLRGNERRRRLVALSVVTRVVSLHACTAPYVPDYRLLGKDQIVYTDDFSVALPIPEGDCEDTVGANYHLYMTLLFPRVPWTDQDVERLRKCAVVLGLPCGLSGVSRDPNDENPEKRHAYGTHMFGAVLPATYFLRAASVDSDVDEKEWADRLCRQYPFVREKSLWLDVPPSYLDGTLMTSPFEEDDENDDYRARFDVVSDWIQRKGDSLVVWRRWSREFTLTHTCEVGHAAFRLFTHAHLRFFPGEGWGVPRDDASFVFERDGEYGAEMQDVLTRRPGFRLVVSVPMREKEAETFLFDRYVRPFVPLVPSRATRSTRATDEDERPKITMFRYKNGEGDEVKENLNGLARALGSKTPKVWPYGEKMTAITFYF